MVVIDRLVPKLWRLLKKRQRCRNFFVGCLVVIMVRKKECTGTFSCCKRKPGISCCQALTVSDPLWAVPTDQRINVP